MNSPAHFRPFLNAQLASTLELLREMVAINSHTLNIAGVNRLGEFTARAFAELGFQAEFIPSVNPAFGRHLVLTRRGQGGSTVGFVSHLDTVFPPEEEARNHFHWRVEGDRIYGPGTEDIKGGTAMMHLMLSALRALRPDVFERTNWVLLVDASEEMASEDFGRLCVERLQAAVAALVFEAGRREGNEFALVTARKGRATFRLDVEGRGAHAGVDHARGASAIAQLAELVLRAEALTDPALGLTVNVGSIGGGGALNRVPHHAWVEGELRAFDGAAYAAGLARLRALEQLGTVRSRADAFACQIRVVVTGETPPWPKNEGTENLLAHWSAAATALGCSVRREERGGLSDGNLMCHVVPTLDGLGPRGDNAHCSERNADGGKDQEYVEISSFVPKAELNLTALLRLLDGGASVS